MAASPLNQTRRCQHTQVTEEVTSQPRNRQQAHGLAERTKKWAATKSGHLSGSGGPQSASSVMRGLGTVVAQTSERGIKNSVL